MKQLIRKIFGIKKVYRGGVGGRGKGGKHRNLFCHVGLSPLFHFTKSKASGTFVGAFVVAVCDVVKGKHFN